MQAFINNISWDIDRSVCNTNYQDSMWQISNTNGNWISVSSTPPYLQHRYTPDNSNSVVEQYATRYKHISEREPKYRWSEININNIDDIMDLLSIRINNEIDNNTSKNNTLKIIKYINKLNELRLELLKKLDASV